MAEWKKLVTSGSNISQLNNDAGYLTSATVPSKNAFATASINGTILIADSPSGSLNFASSSGQGLTISGNSGTDTLTWGLSAVPNSSLLNSGSIIGTTPVNLGTTVTSIAGLTLTTAVVSGSLFGTASYASQALSSSFATSASQAITASFALNANSASFATSASQAITASFALNAASASNSTNAANVAVTDTTTGTGPYYVMFADGTTGNRAVRVDSAALTFNATTNTLTVTSSYANQALSASFATSASFAATASFALNGGTLNVSGSSGNGNINLSNQALSILGTTNEISTVMSGQTLTIGLPTNVTIAGDLAVNGGDITTTQLTASLFNSTATQINIGGSALQMRIGNAAGTITLPGNLNVQGTTTTISSSVLQIADQFILLASGSNTDVDGGIIIQDAADGSGHAFGYGTPENRWVLQSSLNTLSSSFASIDGYVNTTQYGLLASRPANPSYGGASYGYGNFYTATDTSDIFVWA
jgi:hypothetical protein